MTKLSDAQKQQAEELGLTPAEMRFALAVRIPPTRYAELKAEIANEEWHVIPGLGEVK